MAALNVHLYPSPLTHASRMLKETQAIAQFGAFEQILLIGTSACGLPDREAIDASRQIVRLPRHSSRRLPASMGKWSGHAAWCARVYSLLASRQLACINCHSLPVLPLAVALKRRTGARLVYDAHELETEANGLSGARRRLSRLTERMFFRSVDEAIVVSESIGDWYQNEYGGRRPQVVLNCPPYRPICRGNRLRMALSLPDDAIIFIYQGLFAPGRGIELLMDAFDRIDDPRKVLVFMGMGPLEHKIAERCARQANLRLHPAVPPDQVHEYTASADVGFCLIQDSSLSYRYCMPNKLFEYLAAGVPAVVSDLLEIRRVVTGHGAGWVIPRWTPEAVRALVEGLQPDDIRDRRESAARAAKVYSWDRQVPRLREVYQRLGFVGSTDLPGSSAPSADSTTKVEIVGP